VIDVSSLHCTTEQSDTHNTKFYIRGVPGMVIQYLSAERSPRAVEEFFAANLRMFPKGVSLEIPEWMFDMAICHNTRVSQTPTVSAEALLELKLLIAKPPMDGHGIAAKVRHARRLNGRCQCKAHSKTRS